MNDAATVGGRGMNDLRRHLLVRAGDERSVDTEVLESRPSESIPGVSHTRTEVPTNQDGDVVLTTVGLGLVERRESSSGGDTTYLLDGGPPIPGRWHRAGRSSWPRCSPTAPSRC